MNDDDVAGKALGFSCQVPTISNAQIVPLAAEFAEWLAPGWAARRRARAERCSRETHDYPLGQGSAHRRIGSLDPSKMLTADELAAFEQKADAHK